MAIEEIFKDNNSLVLDTSVLIGYFINENLPIIPLLDTYVFNKDSNLILYGHNILKAEIFYTICRKKGMNEAKNVLNKIESVINIISESWLFEIAGKIKCKYPVAFSDCFSIALGYFQECPIIFLKESELSEDIVNKINEDFITKICIVS